MKRFDLDNLNTAATRALAEQRGALEADFAELEVLTRQAAVKKTIAQLQVALNVNTTKSKGELVDDYVVKFTQSSETFKDLEELRMEVFTDRRLAMLFNQMLDAADNAQEIALDKLAHTHMSAHVGVLRSGIIDQYVGIMAARVLAGVVESGYELREVVMAELVDAVKTVLGFVGTSQSGFCNTGLRDEEQIIAANRFRQEVAQRMPQASISLEKFAY